MSDYLHIHCGPHQLLLDAGHVVEVAARGADAARIGERRAWRDRQLPALDLARFLGVAAGERRQQIVISEHRRTDTGDRVLDVDRVERLVNVENREFADISDISRELAAFVDGVWRDGDRCLLRIRYPFAWQTDTDSGDAP